MSEHLGVMKVSTEAHEDPRRIWSDGERLAVVGMRYVCNIPFDIIASLLKEGATKEVGIRYDEYKDMGTGLAAAMQRWARDGMYPYPRNPDEEIVKTRADREDFITILASLGITLPQVRAELRSTIERGYADVQAMHRPQRERSLQAAFSAGNKLIFEFYQKKPVGNRYMVD